MCISGFMKRQRTNESKETVLFHGISRDLVLLILSFKHVEEWFLDFAPVCKETAAVVKTIDHEEGKFYRECAKRQTNAAFWRDVDVDTADNELYVCDGLVHSPLSAIRPYYRVWIKYTDHPKPRRLALTSAAMHTPYIVWHQGRHEWQAIICGNCDSLILEPTKPDTKWVVVPDDGVDTKSEWLRLRTFTTNVEAIIESHKLHRINIPCCKECRASVFPAGDKEVVLRGIRLVQGSPL